MDLQLVDRTFVVTGGSRGIGYATVQVLLEEGARVVACASSEHSRARAQSLLQEYGDRAFVIAGDLRDASSAEEILAKAHSLLGSLTGLVNNAASFGVGRPHPDRVAWSELFQLKLLGYESVLQAALPYFDRGAAIVNVSGLAALQFSPGSPHVTSVNAAVLALTRYYAAALAHRGIRANSVVPGATETDRYAARIEELGRRQNVSLAEAKRALDSVRPSGRAVAPTEIACAIAFLLSPLSGSTTGASLVIDGGASVAAQGVGFAAS